MHPQSMPHVSSIRKQWSVETEVSQQKEKPPIGVEWLTNSWLYFLANVTKWSLNPVSVIQHNTVNVVVFWSFLETTVSIYRISGVVLQLAELTTYCQGSQ